jgi:ribosomal protein L7/L12
MDEVAVARRLRRLEEQVALLSERLGVPFDDPGAGMAPEVVELARSGRKIQAIKVYRELTGVGLAEARDVVDRIS